MNLDRPIGLGETYTGQLEWLYERMSEEPDQTAVVWRGTTTTYADLLQLRKAWDADLDDHGVRPGQVVAVLGDYSPMSCAALLALIDRAVIVVPMTSATAVHHEEFLRVSAADRVLSFDESGSWSWRTVRSGPPHPLVHELVQQGSPGLIVFSSGSTGRNKAMLHDFGRALEKFRVRRQKFVTLTFLLFDHMGGINTLFATLSNGGTVVVTEDRDPDVVCSLIEAYKVELLPVSPTFLSMMLMSGAHHRHDLSSLLRITYGTEVMPQAVLDRIHAEFPAVRLQQTYGLSELGVLRTKSKDDGSLWLKVGGEGVETKVVEGTLWIRSRGAMLGYLNAPDPFDADGWMDTQDKVEVDGEYLKFLGRITDIINVGGNKVYPAEVESVLLELPNVKDAVVFPKPNPILGQVVGARLVLEEQEPLEALRLRVRAHARQRLARYKVPVWVETSLGSAVSTRYKKVRRAESSA